MKICRLIIGSVIFLLFALPTWGMVVEKPTKGQTVVIGESFDVWVRLEAGDVCKKVYGFEVESPPFNSKTGRYEWKETLPTDEPLGTQRFIVLGEPTKTCNDAYVTLTVVLPSTTVLQGIKVDDDQKRLFMRVEAKRKIYVDGQFSDGVERNVSSTAMGTAYTSSDEKVATVNTEGLVTAQGPGTAQITVKNGEHTLTISADVKEKKPQKK